MNGHCSHCRESGEVSRYRLRGVGLRFICGPDAAWMRSVGMDIDAVTDRDPRQPVPGRRVAWTEAVRRDWLGRAWLGRGSRAA